jgi:hypothetical protein
MVPSEPLGIGLKDHGMEDSRLCRLLDISEESIAQHVLVSHKSSVFTDGCQLGEGN